MKSIKPCLILCLFGGLTFWCQAQKIETFFTKMPSSLLSGVSAETRMDLIDFYNNGKIAVMPATFGGKLELKVLADDYLLLRTSRNAEIQLKLLRQADKSFVLVFVRTTAAPLKDSRVRFFDSNWKQLQGIVPPSLSPIDFLKDANKSDSSVLETLAPYKSRFFQTYTFEPKSDVLIVQTSLKENFSLSDRDNLTPLLKDSVLFRFANGRFISY
jgi:hypothetical protein